MFYCGYWQFFMDSSMTGCHSLVLFHCHWGNHIICYSEISQNFGCSFLTPYSAETSPDFRSKTQWLDLIMQLIFQHYSTCYGRNHGWTSFLINATWVPVNSHLLYCRWEVVYIVLRMCCESCTIRGILSILWDSYSMSNVVCAMGLNLLGKCLVKFQGPVVIWRYYPPSIGNFIVEINWPLDGFYIINGISYTGKITPMCWNGLSVFFLDICYLLKW